jgi:hypothetical protein
MLFLLHRAITMIERGLAVLTDAGLAEESHDAQVHPHRFATVLTDQ